MNLRIDRPIGFDEACSKCIIPIVILMESIRKRKIDGSENEIFLTINDLETNPELAHFTLEKYRGLINKRRSLVLNISEDHFDIKRPNCLVCRGTTPRKDDFVVDIADNNKEKSFIRSLGR